MGRLAHLLAGWVIGGGPGNRVVVDRLVGPAHGGYFFHLGLYKFLLGAGEVSGRLPCHAIGLAFQVVKGLGNMCGRSDRSNHRRSRIWISCCLMSASCLWVGRSPL